MNATITVVCYKSKILSNGEHPLMLRICKDGKKKYQSLGVSIKANQWDFVRERPKPTCPNKEYILKLILDKQAELQQRMLELNTEQKEYTTTTLLQDDHKKYELKTVKQFYQELIEQYMANEKYGNRLIYKSSYNSINVFTNGNLEIPFSAIDVAWLNKYEKWLRSKGNKETTMSLLFRTLRSAYNKAIESKCARKSDYPFNDYRISKFDVSTEKRAIAKADVLKFSTDVRPIGKRQYVQLSKDIFIFSYLCGGINFTDYKWVIKDAVMKGTEVLEPEVTLNWGAWIQTIVNFLIVAFCIFVMIKFMNQLRKKKDEEPAPAPAEPSNEEKLLTQIRDLLEDQAKSKK